MHTFRPRRLLPLLALFALVLFFGADAASPPDVAAGHVAGVHGVNSCTGAGACAGNTGTIGANSCQGPNSCFGNTGMIGNGSCNGDSACYYAGFEGSSTIGDRSCNGDGSCDLVGTGGSSRIEDGSCNGIVACYQVGNQGSSRVGDESCNGLVACYIAGFQGSSTIGDGSCNGESVCMFNPGTIGNCESNSSPVTYCRITVVPAEVTVRYGDPIPQLEWTATNGAGAFSDWWAAPGCSSTYTVTSPVAVSPLSISCSGGDASPQETAYTSGTLTILPADLYVSPDAQTWRLGTALPAFSYEVSGWRNGQTAATAKDYVAPTCGPLNGMPTAPGLYTITCNGGSAANYTFVYEGAVLTVTGSLPPTPPPPTPAPAPLPSWQSYLEIYSTSLGLRYEGDCTGATVADAGATCHKATPVTGGMNACLYQVQADGTLSSACITFEFKGAGQEWLLVSQTGSFTAAPAEPTTPVRPAPAPPNTGTGTGGEGAGWLLLFGALAMAVGGAAVWGKSRK